MIYQHLKQMLSEFRSCLCSVSVILHTHKRKPNKTVSDGYKMFGIWCLGMMQGFNSMHIYFHLNHFWSLKFKFWLAPKTCFYFFLHIYFDYYNKNKSLLVCWHQNRPSNSVDGPRSLPRRGIKSRLLQFTSNYG